MSTVQVPAILSAEEYCTLPDIAGYKDELIEGERVLAPMPKFQHTVVLDNLEALLRKQFPDKRVVREAGWRFTSSEGFDSVPGPDLMLVEKQEYDRAAQSGQYFAGTPLFVIDVISPSERRSRRLQKIGLYLEAGVSAVVEVDHIKRVMLVYRADEPAPKLITDRVDWPFTAELNDVFANLP
jgi:Uma2 family endonuclease